MEFVGRRLASSEWTAILTIAKESVHPLSRAIVGEKAAGCASIDYINETIGKGIEGFAMGHSVAIGSLDFIQQHTNHVLRAASQSPALAAAVAVDGEYAGGFMLKPSLRTGISEMIASLREKRIVELLSGDSARDREMLEPLFGAGNMRFGCRPESKIEQIDVDRASGNTVLMVGDGLNDAGAMSAADVAIAVTDDTATLVPACDVIMRTDSLPKLPAVLRFARQMRYVILTSLIFSIFYNALGLTLAIMGLLSPLAAAILMPVSSLTVIAVSVGGARHYSRRLA